MEIRMFIMLNTDIRKSFKKLGDQVLIGLYLLCFVISLQHIFSRFSIDILAEAFKKFLCKREKFQRPLRNVFTRSIFYDIMEMFGAVGKQLSFFILRRRSDRPQERPLYLRCKLPPLTHFVGAPPQGSLTNCFVLQNPIRARNSFHTVGRLACSRCMERSDPFTLSSGRGGTASAVGEVSPQNSTAILSMVFIKMNHLVLHNPVRARNLFYAVRLKTKK